MKRRSFLKVVGSVTAGSTLGLQRQLHAKETDSTAEQEKVAGLPRRVLGRTGEKVSIVGFPGLALTHYDQQRGTEGIHDAFERGVNYFDVAPAYGKDGDCEKKMGIGLQGIDRNRIFLACKTKKRDKEGARLELERSLNRLKTDYFDLYQMHHIRTPEEVKQALGPNGAIETFLKAKEHGKVNYLGFSAHTTKGALEALKGFRFDTLMFPINFVDFFKIGFGKPILKLANEQGVGVFAMKALSHGAWPKGMTRTRKWWYRTAETQEEVDLSIRFSLSHKCVAAGIPPSFLDLLDKAIKAAKSYRPITRPEIRKLRERSQTYESLFLREEQAVAHGDSLSEPIYADSPHECCPCSYA